MMTICLDDVVTSGRLSPSFSFGLAPGFGNTVSFSPPALILGSSEHTSQRPQPGLISWLVLCPSAAAGHQLSNLLKASGSLRVVVASGNRLGDRGLSALSASLSHLKPPRVVSLDLSGNGEKVA